MLLLLYTAITSYITYNKQNEIRVEAQQKARESWEANPDKHPHRMAHFGTFAFRIKHPLSIFDNGIESYTGNAVYLEAHKQNSVNFSEASFSTGLLRFGELSFAMLLQMVLPLILFFLGFKTIASQKENGTLKIILAQGTSFKQLITGNIIGLFGISLLFALPVFIVLFSFLVTQQNGVENTQLFSRSSIILISYLVFLFTTCSIAICISATSNTSKAALLKLLSTWLLLAIVIPKTVQAIGSFIYPAPSKIQFETLIEEALLKQGDSHNPNDEHYKALKDSVLKANNVDSVQKLSFNYSGFQMKEGERLSAEIYNVQLQKLNEIYQAQNKISYLSSFINPFASIKYSSMAISETDFNAYIHFTEKAEQYRYKLAQTMNDLQIKYISNKKLSSTDKPYSIEKSNWTSFPDFKYAFQSLKTILIQQKLALLSIFLWLALSVFGIHFSSLKAKAI